MYQNYLCLSIVPTPVGIIIIRDFVGNILILLNFVKKIPTHGTMCIAHFHAVQEIFLCRNNSYKCKNCSYKCRINSLTVGIIPKPQ